MTITYFPRSVELTCYRVKRMRRAAFHVNGTTLILPPEAAGDTPIFWRQVAAHGKLERLCCVAPSAPWVRGIPSALIKE